MIISWLTVISSAIRYFVLFETVRLVSLLARSTMVCMKMESSDKVTERKSVETYGYLVWMSLADFDGLSFSECCKQTVQGRTSALDKRQPYKMASSA